MPMWSVKVSVEHDNLDQAEDLWHHVQHCLSLVEVQNLGWPAEVAAGCRCRSAVTLPYQNVGHCVAACALGARR